MREPASRLLACALVAICLLATKFPLPVAGQAQGLGVSPPRAGVTDAQAGQAYVRTVSLQNQFDGPSTIMVEAEGAAGGWTTTEPSSGFTMGARSAQDVRLRIAVPAGTGPGAREGLVRFTTEPKGSPDGSGAGVRYAVAVLLNVSVGGTPRIELTWLDARAPDGVQGAPPAGYARVRNDGNVRASATMDASVLAFEADTALGAGQGTAQVEPGAEAEVEVVFTQGLEAGQYRMRFTSRTPSGFTDEVEFKVARPGEHPPTAILRGLRHPAVSEAGALLRVQGLLANTGAVPIVAARLTVEVRQGDAIVDVLRSEAVAVRPGQEANLTVYWTPAKAGAYTLVGQVNYDGLVTQENHSPLTVHGAAGGWGWWPWLLLILLVLVVGGLVAWLLGRRRGGRRDRGDGPQRKPSPAAHVPPGRDARRPPPPR